MEKMKPGLRQDLRTRGQGRAYAQSAHLGIYCWFKLGIELESNDKVGPDYTWG